MEGCKLVPARPFTLSGHLRFEGQQPGDFTQYTVYLQSADDLDDGGVSDGVRLGRRSGRAGGPPRQLSVDGRDSRTLRGASERWRGKDGFLKSAALGSLDATAGFKVGGPASVDLVVNSKGGMLEGTVLDKDQPVANASVVAVPEEKYRKIRQHFGIGSTDQNGHFVIHGLAPGTYTIFAWQDVEDGLYYDAEFLKSQEGNGTALKVEEGSRLKIELEPVPVSEEWQ